MQDTQLGFRTPVKALLFYGIFLLFYGLFKVLPIFPLTLICGVCESNFQHYKATFFCYLLVNVVEYAVFRKRITDRQQFWYPRLLAAIFAPWLVFLLWYIAPALYGKFPTIALEVVYANVITLLVAFFAITFEKGFHSMVFSPSLKAAVLTLFVVSIGLYIIFTFKLPWADVFIEPEWRDSSLLFWRV